MTQITQQLLLNGLVDLIDAGIAILVPVVVHYVFTKTKKHKFEMYSAIAKSAVSATLQSTGVTEEAFKNEAAKRLSLLTKGKVKADLISHLIEAAMTELKTDVAQSIAKEKEAETK